MKKTILVTIVTFVLAFSAFAQASKYAPSGVRKLTAAEYQDFSARLKSGEFAASKTQSAVTTSANTPFFAIRVTGDSYTGISATARSTRLIPTGSILFGSRIGVTGNVEYLYPQLVSNDIPAGWLWYDIENSRKGVYTELNGRLEYQMTVITGGQIHLSSALADFMSYQGSTIPHTITDGVSVYQNGVPHFYLYGNFGGAVGVASLKSVQGQFEIDVPPNAITLLKGRVDIDFSQIPDAYLQPSDYLITIADQNGYSDNFVLRHTPAASNASLINEKRFRTLTEQYDQ